MGILSKEQKRFNKAYFNIKNYRRDLISKYFNFFKENLNNEVEIMKYKRKYNNYNSLKINLKSVGKITNHIRVEAFNFYDPFKKIVDTFISVELVTYNPEYFLSDGKWVDCKSIDDKGWDSIKIIGNDILLQDLFVILERIKLLGGK